MEYVCLSTKRDLVTIQNPFYRGKNIYKSLNFIVGNHSFNYQVGRYPEKPKTRGFEPSQVGLGVRRCQIRKYLVGVHIKK